MSEVRSLKAPRREFLKRSVALAGAAALSGAGAPAHVALGDKAAFVTATVQRDQAGRITGVAAGPIRPLLAAKTGQPLAGRLLMLDARAMEWTEMKTPGVL